MTHMRLTCVSTRRLVSEVSNFAKVLVYHGTIEQRQCMSSAGHDSVSLRASNGKDSVVVTVNLKDSNVSRRGGWLPSDCGTGRPTFEFRLWRGHACQAAPRGKRQQSSRQPSQQVRSPLQSRRTAKSARVQSSPMPRQVAWMAETADQNAGLCGQMRRHFQRYRTAERRPANNARCARIDKLGHPSCIFR